MIRGADDGNTKRPLELSLDRDRARRSERALDRDRVWLSEEVLDGDLVRCRSTTTMIGGCGGGLFRPGPADTEWAEGAKICTSPVSCVTTICRVDCLPCGSTGGVELVKRPMGLSSMQYARSV